MTVAISFYHLLTTPFEHAFVQLVGKMAETGKRCLVLAEGTERVEYLNTLLWTHNPDSFIPHGSAADGFAAEQPVYLAATDENPNQSVMLMLLDRQTSPLVPDMERVLVLFDGRDPEAVSAARQQWQGWKAAGYGLTYFRQNERGGWDKSG